MANPRVHEVAAELGIDSKIALDKLKDMGEFVKSASSSIPPPVARRLKVALSQEGAGTALLFPAASGDSAAEHLRSLPRGLPAFMDLLREASAGSTTALRVPTAAFSDTHYYFCPRPIDRGPSSIAREDLPSDSGIALLPGPAGVEVLAWYLSDALHTFHGVLGMFGGRLGLGQQRRAVRVLSNGRYYVEDGRTSPRPVARLAAMVDIIPTVVLETSPRSSAAQRPSLHPVESDVRIVYLRRDVTAREQVRATVKRESRWLVRGHWRNQWYPSLSDHRRVWIAEHEAGADGVGVAARQIVYVISSNQNVGG